MGMFLYNLIIYPLVVIIEFTFMLFYELFDTVGISVIGVSLAVSFLCLPLYIVAERWQETERRQQLKMKGQLARIKKTFSGDERYMITTAFYKESHYSPIMALRSSFGLLIQIPFFIAAYSFLSNVPILQGQSFWFVRDMGKADALFTIGSFDVNILPIAMTVINIIAGAVYTKGHALREKIQIYAMALVFLVLLYNSPAGLVIYWTMNNIFSLVKNIFYKIKRPLLVLYIIACAAALYFEWNLLFDQPGLLHKRLVMMTAVALVFFIPLLVKLSNNMLNTILSPLVDHKKTRFGIYILSFISLAMLFGFVIPANTIFSSVQEFADIDNYGSPLFFAFNTFIQALGLFVFWTLCIYFLFHSRIQTFIAVSGVFILVASLINAFVFPGNYGSLSRMLTFEGNVSSPAHNTYNLLNLIVLLSAFILLFIIFAQKKIKIISAITGIIALALGTNGIIRSVSITKDYNYYEKTIATGIKNKELTPVYHLSKTGKNVIILMMDRMRNAYITPIFEEYPELVKEFDGFKIYKNTFSFGTNTIVACPSVWGGYEYTPINSNKRADIKLIDKNNEATLMLPRIFSEQADYDVTLSDSSWANFSWVSDMSITNPYPKINGVNTERKYSAKWISEHKDILEENKTSKVLRRNFFWLSVFECAPAAARDALYDDGLYFSSTTPPDDVDEFINCYSALDYLPLLTDFSSTKEGTFTAITNELPHCEVKLNAPDFLPSLQKGNQGNCEIADAHCFSTNVSSYKVLGKFFQFLKKNDCFDNTRIIVVADHGGKGQMQIDFPQWSDTTADTFVSPESVHPMLMIKDFNSREPLKYDYETFMSNADVPLLATADIISSPFNPFTGNVLKADDPKCASGITTGASHLPEEHSKFKYKYDEVTNVKDNIFNESNWRKVE